MSAPEIQEGLEKSLDYYLSEIDRYTEEQFQRKPSEFEWSLAQMYEHLTSTALYFFFKRATYCMEQRNGQVGGEKNEFGVKQYKYNSFPPIQIKIPEVLRGPEPEGKSKEAYKDLIEKIRLQGRELGPKTALDEGEYKCLQPAFGWLTAFEWYWLCEQHFRHHLLQKQRLDAFLAT